MLPLIAGLVTIAVRRGDNTAKAIWMPAFFITVAAAFVNVSKGASIVTLGLLLFLGYQRFRQWRGASGALSWKVLLIYGMLALGGLGAIYLVAKQTLLVRWMDQDWMTGSGAPRLLANQVSLRALRDAGPWGFGPGTFQHVFPHYTAPMGDAIAGYWKYAHEDYLQTLIEWGWLGWLPLSVLLFGGLGLAFHHAQTAVHSADRVLLRMIGLALTGISLHALVDFPLQIASLQLYCAVLLGMAWGARHWERTRIGPKTATPLAALQSI